MKKNRLKDMDITRVDLVDRGAAQNADIVFYKADTGVKDRIATFLKERSAAPTSAGMRPKAPAAPAAPAPAKPAPAPGPADPTMTPLARPKGAGSRIIRIAPTDFEVVRADGNMMEWAIPPDKLPEGVEEALVTMVQSGEAVAFQWMIDPLAGPPVEGQAKTAAEAFVAMRGALTNTSAMDPMQMLGGFPSQKPPVPPVPGMGMGGGGAGPKGQAPSPRLRKHAGPGPHPSGSDQSVHGGKGGGGTAQDVFEYLDRDDKFKSGPRIYQQAREAPRYPVQIDDLPSRRNRLAIKVRNHKSHPRTARSNYSTFEYPDGTTSPQTEEKKRRVASAATMTTSTSLRGWNSMYKAIRNEVKKRNRDETVSDLLDIITKGLIEVDVFKEDTTGDDLRDILPPDLLEELRKLSAKQSAE